MAYQRPNPKTHPEPTVPEPDLSEVEYWIYDGVAESTDGCMVEPDGFCPHGHPSWLIVFGII